MSLINDALKRTQQTTQAGEPPRTDELEMRPIESDQLSASEGGGGAKRIIWVVVLFVVAGNIALWVAIRNPGDPLEAAARTARTDTETLAVRQAGSAPAATASSVPAKTTATDAVRPAATIPSPEPSALERPALNLRTIVFHPVRPSAMINGRVLFVGDRVDGYTVTAIGKNDVTLELNGEKVRLSLP